ncbi:hypothetical protein OIN60_12105 [Paenibacillus sp. P96]|uniref:DUF2802 domain-containing protein n=1 Tax=Paenibacillus zeirhizosphaerae TaxID=2987519 RepID=A0ABT9FS11_9BACL|nr:hypothetical protein [Paenibacillus sp. P96]MDP4097514.1 hypothetical protein [Paenibacillus sp. P96]
MDPWVYIVLLGAAALMYGWMLPKRGSGRSTDEALVKNMEATLEQYMADIARENDELIDLVAQMKQEQAARQIAVQKQIAELRQQMIELERQDLSRLDISQQAANLFSEQPSQAHPLTLVQEAEQYTSLPPLTDHVSEKETVEPPETIRDRYGELFTLYGQGKSLDSIAKQTGMQRGEVQLILQLAEREGQDD